MSIIIIVGLLLWIYWKWRISPIAMIGWGMVVGYPALGLFGAVYFTYGWANGWVEAGEALLSVFCGVGFVGFGAYLLKGSGIGGRVVSMAAAAGSATLAMIMTSGLGSLILLLVFGEDNWSDVVLYGVLMASVTVGVLFFCNELKDYDRKAHVLKDYERWEKTGADIEAKDDQEDTPLHQAS